MSLIRRFVRRVDPTPAIESSEDAKRQLEEVKARTPKIRRLAESLIEVQERNHLGATAAKVLRGER